MQIVFKSHWHLNISNRKLICGVLLILIVWLYFRNGLLCAALMLYFCSSTKQIVQQNLPASLLLKQTVTAACLCVRACVGFPVDIVLMSQYSNYQSFCLHLINESAVLIHLQSSLWIFCQCLHKMLVSSIYLSIVVSLYHSVVLYTV